MMLRYADKPRGFTLVELLVALAIFGVVMSGVAIVFTSSMYASNSIRSRLEDYGEFRGFSSFVERDLSSAYRSVDLDDRLTFMGGQDRVVFVGVSQNFGETDFTLMSYYTLPDNSLAYPDGEYAYRRLMRLAIPMPYRAIKSFMATYPRQVQGILGQETTSPTSADPQKEFFPSDRFLEKIAGDSTVPPEIVHEAGLLLQVSPADRLFPTTTEQVQALFAVLNYNYKVNYGFGSYVWDPVNPVRDPDGNDKYAPQLDDFELASLIDGGEIDAANAGPGLRFRYGRIRALPPELIPKLQEYTYHDGQGYHGYAGFPERVTDAGFVSTLQYDWRDEWNARIEGGPPEVVEVTAQFMSKTRRRGIPYNETFQTIIFVPMGFDAGTEPEPTG